jgi:D-amino-acid dehydrogenase
MLWKNAKTGDHEKQLADEAHAYGLKTVVCDAGQVQAYETQTEVDVAGGVLYLDDCHLNPAKLMQSLYTSLTKAGVKFYLETDVVSFERAGEKITAVITTKEKIAGDEFVMANGSWMQQMARKLGIYIPLQPGKGYSMVYNEVQNNLLYPSILVDDRVATTPIHNWLRIGGTMELSGHSDTILPKRVMAIYNAFKKYYPTLEIPAPDTGKAWFGYRPVSPDGMPYIGRHRAYENLVIAGGHAMLGVSAAAGTGRLVKEILAGEPLSISLDAFEPGRFR